MILGQTALHDAVEAGHVESVRVLLKHGASRTVVERNGKTAYELAKANGKADVAWMLGTPGN